MVTYADWWNQRAEHAGHTRPSGPVQWTIGATSWEQVQLMDTDDPAPAQPAEPTSNPSTSTGALTAPIFGTSATSVPMPPGEIHSYFLLDTNVLMHPICLTVLQRVADYIFEHNLAIHQHLAPGAPRVALLVPRTVLKELDNLKSLRKVDDTSEGARRAREAQAANRFILSVLRRQNRPLDNGSDVPKSCWALHVQTIEHALERERSLSNDEKIVRLAAAIQRDSGAKVALFTNDINASVSAEAEGVMAIDLASQVSAQGVRDSNLGSIQRVAEMIVNEWRAYLLSRQPITSVPTNEMFSEPVVQQPPTAGQGWRLCTDGLDDARTVIEILDDNDAEMLDLDALEASTPSHYALQQDSDETLNLTSPNQSRSNHPHPSVSSVPRSSTRRSRYQSDDSVPKRTTSETSDDEHSVLLISTDDDKSEEDDDDEPIVVAVINGPPDMTPSSGDIKLDASYFSLGGAHRLDSLIGTMALPKTQKKKLRTALSSLKITKLFPGKQYGIGRGKVLRSFESELRHLARHDRLGRQIVALQYNSQIRIAFRPHATTTPPSMAPDLNPIIASFELLFSPRLPAGQKTAPATGQTEFSPKIQNSSASKYAPKKTASSNKNTTKKTSSTTITSSTIKRSNNSTFPSRSSAKSRSGSSGSGSSRWAS